MSELSGARSAWENFYVIVGGSGGALIGLQFVVITLNAWDTVTHIVVSEAEDGTNGG